MPGDALRSARLLTVQALGSQREVANGGQLRCRARVRRSAPWRLPAALRPAVPHPSPEHRGLVRTCGRPSRRRDVSGSFDCRKAVPSPCRRSGGSGNWSNHAYGLRDRPQPTPRTRTSGCGARARPGERPPTSTARGSRAGNGHAGRRTAHSARSAGAGAAPGPATTQRLHALLGERALARRPERRLRLSASSAFQSSRGGANTSRAIAPSGPAVGGVGGVRGGWRHVSPGDELPFLVARSGTSSSRGGPCRAARSRGGARGAARSGSISTMCVA